MLLNPKTKSATTTTNTANKPPATSWIAKELPPSSYPGLSSDPFNVSLPSRNTTTSRGAIVPPGGNLRNVMSFKDFGGLGAGSGGNGSSGRPVSGSKSTTPNREDWGRGTSLSTSSSSSYGAGNTSVSSSPERKVDRKHLRDIWAKRFGGDNGSSEGNGIGKNGDIGEKRLNNEKPTGKFKAIVKISFKLKFEKIIFIESTISIHKALPTSKKNAVNIVSSITFCSSKVL